MLVFALIFVIMLIEQEHICDKVVVCMKHFDCFGFVLDYLNLNHTMDLESQLVLLAPTG
jgi:hypothetical protein